MFVIHTVYDIRIQIPPVLQSIPTLQAIHNEIDQTYPNRVLMDVGLVVCRYGDCLEIGHGVCVPGDNGVGGPYHPCTFRLVVFRPFVEEVCLGRIAKSTSEGIHVSCGFFDNIFIPAYWMLRPSRYEESTGLWVWEPDYSDDDDDDDDDEDDDGGKEQASASGANANDKQKQSATNVKMEEGTEHDAANTEGEARNGGAEAANGHGDNDDENENNRYEMGIGSEIRFKVKSIHFAQVTKTAKGMQAFVTSTDKQPRGSSVPNGSSGSSSSRNVPDGSLSFPGPLNDTQLVRKRSSSVGLDDSQKPPSTMNIMASICEDGLGLTLWWAGGATAAEEEDEEEHGEVEAAEANGEKEVVVEEHDKKAEHHNATMNGSII